MAPTAEGTKRHIQPTLIAPIGTTLPVFTAGPQGDMGKRLMDVAERYFKFLPKRKQQMLKQLEREAPRPKARKSITRVLQ